MGFSDRDIQKYYKSIKDFKGSKILNDKLKISTDQIRTNKNIGEIDPFRPLEEDEKKLVQRGVNQIYSDFLSIVAEGRSMTTNEVDRLARGRVYYGNEGKELNLIDIVGEFNDAIILAADLADIEKYQIIEYPKQKTEIANDNDVSTSIMYDPKNNLMR